VSRLSNGPVLAYPLALDSRLQRLEPAALPAWCQAPITGVWYAGACRMFKQDLLWLLSSWLFLVMYSISFPVFMFIAYNWQAFNVGRRSRSRGPLVFGILFYIFLGIYGLTQFVTGNLPPDMQFKFLYFFTATLAPLTHFLAFTLRNSMMADMLKGTDYIYFGLVFLGLARISQTSFEHASIHLDMLSSLFVATGVAIRVTRTTAEILRWHRSTAPHK
jgi:hypothetical protein